MTRFDRVGDTLQALKGQETITLEDAMGLFLDLCEDIKCDGMSIENLGVGNQERLLTNLSRSGRILLKIIKKKSGDLEQVDTGGRIHRQEEQIAVQIEELQEKETELESFRIRLEKMIRDREERQKIYQDSMQKIEEKRRYLQKLDESCEKLKGEIEEMSRLSSVDLEEKKDMLTSRKLALETQIEKQRLELKALESEIRSLEDRRVSESRPLKEKAAELEQLQKDKETELEQLRQDIKKTDRDIISRANAINQAKEDLKDKQKTVAILRDEQSKLNGNVVTIQNEIDRLRDHLNNSDVAKLEEERRRLNREKLQVDREIEEQKAAIEKEEKALKDSREELQDARDQFEKEKSRILDHNATLRERLNTLNDQIQENKKAKAQMEKKLADAEEASSCLESWFRSLEADKYRERLVQAEQKVKMFTQAQRELFYETDDLGMNQGMTNQEANEKREELRRQMDDIEELIGAYRRKYNIICGMFSDF